MSLASNVALGGTLLASLTLCGFRSAPHEGHVHGAGTGQAGAGFEHAPRDGKRYTVGNDRALYLWESDWLKLPKGREWLGSTHGCIVTDAGGNVYLSADTGDAVQVFGPDGAFLRSFGGDWGAGVHGLSIVTEAESEFLYIAHTAKQRVFKTTLTGKIVLELEFPEASGKYENRGHYKPTSVCMAPDGTLFVADGYGLSWIHRYDSKGKYLDSFGGPGDQPGNLRTPHGLWMDTHGDAPTLLVSDRENHRIARFSLEGKFLNGTDPKSGLLRRPCHLQFDGDVAVVADLAGRVTLLDRNLELIAHLGDNPDKAQRANFGVKPKDWRDGCFTAPHCARIDSKGNILVMDWNVAGRITRLVPLNRVKGQGKTDR